MFTGLVEEVGEVRRVERGPAGGRLTVGARRVLEGSRVGDSVAISGVCLTLIDVGREGFTVECMPETFTRTTLGEARPGFLVNLERSLAWGARLGGHLVLGHVDGVGEIVRVRQQGIATAVQVSLPAELAGCVAPKGSIAVDGISLTVVAVGEEDFEVGIIPHTLKETTLQRVRAGMRVNLEADVLARYVRQSLQTFMGNGAAGASAPDGLTEEFLRERGFA